MCWQASWWWTSCTWWATHTAATCSNCCSPSYATSSSSSSSGTQAPRRATGRYPTVFSGADQYLQDTVYNLLKPYQLMWHGINSYVISFDAGLTAGVAVVLMRRGVAQHGALLLLLLSLPLSLPLLELVLGSWSRWLWR